MNLNIVKEEEKILRFWKENKVFQKTLNNRKKGKPFVFFEGPPTANGKPGIHHVLTRAFKDIILRYKTMRGFFVWRRAGWDTHGLPVELEVEKELGLNTKKDIENYGIDKFNQKCRQSVLRYKEDWENLTERMGFWIDMTDSYITYDPRYMENLWAVIKKFSEKGLLFEDFKVVPYCARCGTTISSHEVAQGYQTTTDRSVVVKFPIKSSPKAKSLKLKAESYVLAWTTTPWTLPGNVALAVGSKITYVIIRKKNEPGETSGVEEDPPAGGDGRTPDVEEGEADSGELYILAKDRLEILKDGYEIVKEIKGSDLVGLEYEPLFEIPQLKSDKSYKIYSADFVSTEEGTGVVHTAVMYGVDDFELGNKVGLPKFHTVDENGKFIDSAPVVGGKEIVTNKRKNKETEDLIINYLKKEKLLFKEEKISHEYPFCWRCQSPLLYYARHSWFIGTNSRKNELVKNNQKINWIPDYIKDGRFGEWLSDVKDWAFSRERYWGTPLPVWQCQTGKPQTNSKLKIQNSKEGGCSNFVVVGSLDDLNELRADKPTKFILMRHGQALSNEKRVVSSWPEEFENSLTQKGKKQIKKAAKKLKKEKIDFIYSSDFTRTLETADILANVLGIKINTDERLREISVGELNNESIEDYHHFFAFLRERLFKKPDGGESWLDVRQRMWKFIQEINKKYPGKTVLVVSHGLPLALLESSLRGITTDELLSWEEENELGTGDFHQVDFPNWPFNKDGEIDLHRPYVDEIKIKCSHCGLSMSRVKEVVDVWFDSGAMPFAQPAHKKKLGEPIKGQFPADYISEGIDQTRGWFYTLHAISTLLGKGPSYLNVITYSHVLDKDGKKMSKSVGNVVDPWEMIEKYGIDALRWYFFTVNSPGDPKLFNEKDLAERHRRFVMTIINSLIFLETYWGKPDNFSANPKTNIMDEWIGSRLAFIVDSVTKKLDHYDVVGSARDIDLFVQDLSNWYIRRSRTRLQEPSFTAERLAVQKTLFFVLLTLSQVLAPFTPFLADIIYCRLAILGGPKLKESVHLDEWPKNKEKRNEKLEKSMEVVRQLVSLALAKRAEAGIKVRQPLDKLGVSPTDAEKIRGFELVLADEINVAFVTIDPKLSEGEVQLDIKITPKLERDGVFREFTRAVNELRRKIGLTPKDQIELVFHVKKPDGAGDNFSDRQGELKKETRAKSLVFGPKEDKTFLAEKEFKERCWEVWVGIRKI